MGQQQILLIVLGVILVGIAVILGLEMFRDSYQKNEEDNIAWQLLDSAHSAYQYFLKPLSQGGTGKDMEKVLADSTKWMPELKYAQDVSLSGNNTDLQIQASTTNGKKRATMILRPNGDMDLTWEDL